jgi:hypothetical protein
LVQRAVGLARGEAVRLTVPAAGWVSLGVAAFAAAVYRVGCDQNEFYRNWSPFVTAEYAEPWRTRAAVVVCLLPLVVWHLVTRPGANFRRWRGVVALGWLMSFGLAVELGKGIYFETGSGELRVATILLTHREFRLVATTEGICASPDFDNPFVWRLGGHYLLARALPLPLDDALFKSLIRELDALQHQGAAQACSASAPSIAGERAP